MLALLFVAAQPQTGQAPAAPPIITPQTVVAAIQPRLPQRFSPDVAMVGAAADGDALVLTYEISDSALAATTPEALSLRFATAFCAAPGGTELLSGAMNFRADARSPNGRTLRGVMVETCPLPLPEALPRPTGNRR